MLAATAAMAFALILLVAPATAPGQSLTVPPGNSEADQYFEATPDATGDKSIDGSRSPDEVLSARQLAELEALGADGVAAAALAAGTAPRAGTGEGGSTDQGGGGPNAGAAALGGDEQGMGRWLWLIVAVGAISALAYGGARLRARRGRTAGSR